MNTVMAAIAPETRCRIDEVFTKSFIELISMAPRNPVVRSLILALTRKMPPPDRQSFDEIKQWVETSCVKKGRRPAEPAVGSTEGISIPVQFSDREYGRANYTVNRYSDEEYRLTEEELLEIAEEVLEAGSSLDALVDRVFAQVKETAWDRCDPCLGDDGEYEYDEHDSTDTGHPAVSVGKAQLRELVMRFLQNQHPEIMEQLT
jgi:hypothetical protein